MAKNMPRGLVALGSTAIAAVYFAGLVATRGADASTASAATAAISSPATTNTSGVSVVIPSQLSTGAAQTGAYTDGTYNGTGTSRFGSIAVAVTVQGGNIAKVTITDSTTSYPSSRIAALPARVVTAQSAQINTVSGATYSSQAFKQAVQQALTQAQTA